MQKQKIALQVYSVRGNMKEDFYGTLKQVKEFGYDGVEFAGLHGKDPAEVKKMCEELGLIPISAHVPIKELMEDMDGTIESYRILGVKYVVIPWLPAELRPDQEAFRTVLIPFLNKLGEALAAKGIVLQYHNHDFEFVKLDGEYALDILYKEVGPEKLQTQLDTCWVNVGGEDPVGYVKKYAGRLPTVHLKDFVGTRSANMYKLVGINENEKQEAQQTFEFRALGRGVQNIPAIAEASVASGAGWLIVEQDESSEGFTPMESVKISAEYLLNTVFD